MMKRAMHDLLPLRPIRRLCLTLGLTLCAAGTVATGVPTAAVAQERDMAAAKERFLAGKEAYEAERYEEAAEAFTEAYDLSGRNELLYNIGQAYRKAGQLKKAEEYFQQYLNELPEAPNADQVVETIIEIQEEMAAQMATLRIESTPADARVFIDGEMEPRCKTPCPVSLMPGEHELRLAKAGYKETTKTIEVEPESERTVAVRLKRDVVFGYLDLRTDTGSGQVRVAGQPARTLPLSEPIELEPGTYPVTVVGESGEAWTMDLEVRPEETNSVLVPVTVLEEQSGTSPIRTASYALMGSSLGFFVGGVLLGMEASDAHASLETQQQALGQVDSDLVDRGESMQLGANIMYGAGAATLLSGAGLFVWDAYFSDDEAPQPEPTQEMETRRHFDEPQPQGDDEETKPEVAPLSEDGEEELF